MATKLKKGQMIDDEYKKNMGCPGCGYGQFTGGEEEVWDDYMTFLYHCTACSCSWEETYQLQTTEIKSV